MRKVDIVIPVYNAYDDLVICINSLKKYTDLEQHRAILINDCSPDERIRPYLDGLAEEGFTVIYNEKNKGFSGNVNLGFQQSEDRDVLLLNTDTILTKGWLEKIIRCAYSDPAIATVTPLSNNATLCSVPEFCEENTLPNGFTLDEFAELIESRSLRRYPRITVAVGFCMYIKREVINVIGNFDAETFERGYGEENDFCCRAEQAGYYHAMCDDAYVYHTGTKSFVSKEKQKYIDAHETILNQRYPLQMQRNREHVRDNPNSFVQNNLKIYIPFHNGKKNILYLAQSDFQEDADDHVGGIQLHVKDLTMGLKDDYNIFVVARDRSYIRCTGYAGDQVVPLKFYVGEKPDYPVFHDKKLRKIYDNILNAFSIDMVHVHHVLGMSLEMYYAAKELEIPVITTIHDYYMVCPSEKLLDAEGRVCCNGESAERCASCLKKKEQIADTMGYLKIWRARNLEVLEDSKKIIVPSYHTAKMIATYYPELEQKIEVVEHGSEELTDIPELKHDEKKFRVAFVGGINESKGSQIIYELVKKSNADIDWYIFGGLGDRELLYLEKKNLHKMGPYVREELPELIRKNSIDLICIFSIWPETFCYTLSEAILCRIPVVVSGIGALGERVEQLKCGWTIENFHDAEHILAKIRELKEKPEEYQQCVERLCSLELRTVDEMVDCYQKLYQSFLEDKKSICKGFDVQEIYRGYALASGEKIVGMEISGNILERLNEAETSLYLIYNSTSYKLINKLKELPIPGKSFIKLVLYKVYKRNR